MIFISDSANSQSLGWLQDLDRDARRSGGDSQFKKTLAAEALPTTQISIEVGTSGRFALHSKTDIAPRQA